MRAKALFIAGLAALIVGIVGLAATLPAAAAPSPFNGFAFGPGAVMAMPGMAGMMGGPVPADAVPISIEQASAAAQNYIARLGDDNLEMGEVMEFLANYYVQVVERDTGIHAFELLVDKYTGTVFPEMGPNMVWNTRYGMMGGMMGWRRFDQRGTPSMPIQPQEAQELARRYLETQGLRLDVAEPDRFYGYYTLHTLRQGEIEGMLSVNGFSGEVWYHVWHGPFVRMGDSQAEAGEGLP